MPVMDGIKSTAKIREWLLEQGICRADQPIILGATGHVHDEFGIQGR